VLWNSFEEMALTLAFAQTPSTDDVCLSSILDAVSTEVDDLLATGDRLQSLVGDLVDKSGTAISTHVLVEAQGLDAMVQRLSALSAFLQALSPAVPAHWIIDPTAAAQGLSLADSARRFACRVEEHTSGKITSGEIDLF
jgi:hypothetical protein